MSHLVNDSETSELAVFDQERGLMANGRNHKWPKSHLKLPSVLGFSFLKSMSCIPEMIFPSMFSKTVLCIWKTLEQPRVPEDGSSLHCRAPACHSLPSACILLTTLLGQSEDTHLLCSLSQGRWNHNGSQCLYSLSQWQDLKICHSVPFCAHSLSCRREAELRKIHLESSL